MSRGQPPESLLGAFLWKHRQALGLSQEKTAQLVPISVGYYARIEQGKSVPKREILERIAEVLKLNRSETQYMCNLAGHYSRNGSDLTCPVSVPAALRSFVDYLMPAPAYVIDVDFNIVYGNRASELIYDVTDAAMASGQENVAWRMFNSRELRTRLVAWEEHARDLVAACRFRLGQVSEDSPFAILVNSLKQQNDEFRRLWSPRGCPSLRILRQTRGSPFGWIAKPDTIQP